jgi:hypothetical protein
MFTINLKDPPNLGFDEGIYLTDADRANGGQLHERGDAIVEVSRAGRSPERQVPTPVRGFASTGGWGLW